MSVTEIAAAPVLTAPWHEVASDRFVRDMPGYIERLAWDAERLRDHQSRALAHLLRTAISKSPFHRRRLNGIDPASITSDRLVDLPVMTKAEMMDDLDEVFTDRRLSRSLIEQHLAELGTEPELLLDEYLALTSGGSSGTRGVFVLSQSDAIDFAVCCIRPAFAKLIPAIGWPPPTRIPVAFVTAPKALHATRALPPLLSAVADITYAPATLPIDDMIERLERAQPMIMMSYPSILARLGDAAAAGRLTIAPKIILATSEQLQADHVARITAGFGMPPGNGFGSSEGLAGSAPPGSDEFSFASDRSIVEFVDADDRPVPSGTPAHHVLITNLTNHVQPLIRYRLDDVMTELPAADHGHQRATVGGRNDELLAIGGATVHPLTVRSALLAWPAISEYQVRVANREPRPTLDVAVVATDSCDLDAVRRDLIAALLTAGAAADVSVRVVDRLERHPHTGKVRRFITA